MRVRIEKLERRTERIVKYLPESLQGAATEGPGQKVFLGIGTAMKE